MRKAEFKINCEKVFDRKNDLMLRIYKGSQKQFSDWNDNKIDDVKYFFNEDEAIDYANNLDLSIGFSGFVENLDFYYNDFNKAFEFGEELEFKDFNKHSYYIDEVYRTNINSGESIEGALIIRWSYEKYVGYARNLDEIGIGGTTYPFYDLKTEKDLITGNEESTYSMNFSVLLTKQEIEKSSNLEEDVLNALNSSHWKWNNFKNNPDTMKTAIDEIILQLS